MPDAGAAAPSAPDEAGTGVWPLPLEAGAAAANGSSLGSSRLAVLPGSPRGRTVAVQSPSVTSGPALPPEMLADWPLAEPVVLRSTTGAMAPPPQAAVISTAVSMKVNEGPTRISRRMVSLATPPVTGL